MTARQIGYLALIGFAIAALAGIVLRPLIPIDETRYVGVAWEMRVTGDWLVPHKNGAIYTDKPPLLFWLINIVWLVTGVGEWAARLVGPAFGLVTIAATWALGRRIWDDATGARAAAVLAGFTVFALYGGATMFDTMVAAAVLLGVGALWSALMQGGGRRAWLLFGLALAMGVYAKGPVILVHLLPVLLTYPLWVPAAQRPSPAVVARGTALALVVAVALVAIWLVPAAITGGAEYRRMILWEQSSGRISASFAHARPWWFLAATLPVALFPWFWVPAAWRGLRRLDRRDPGLRLAALWAAGGLLLFSLISGKQVHYLVPEFPAVALLIARALGPQAETRPAAWAAALFPGTAAMALGLGVLAVATGLIGGGDPAAALLRPAVSVLAALAVMAAVLVIASRLPLTAGIGAVGLGVVLSLNLGVGLTALHQAYDARPLAYMIAGHEDKGIAVVVPKYHAEFNFAARLSAPLAELAPEALDGWLRAHPEGRVIGLCGHTPLAAPATREVLFNGKPYCMWESAGAPAP